jgi:hypothetical protein
MRYVEGFLLKGASVLAGVQRNLGWSTMSDTYQHNNGDVREPLACLWAWMVEPRHTPLNTW